MSKQTADKNGSTLEPRWETRTEGRHDAVTSIRDAFLSLPPELQNELFAELGTELLSQNQRCSSKRSTACPKKLSRKRNAHLPATPVRL
jgi:hypothetical protein